MSNRNPTTTDAWCAIDPSGKLQPAFCGESEGEAWMVAAHNQKNPANVADLMDAGWTVRRVRIEVIPDSD